MAEFVSTRLRKIRYHVVLPKNPEPLSILMAPGALVPRGPHRSEPGPHSLRPSPVRARPSLLEALTDQNLAVTPRGPQWSEPGPRVTPQFPNQGVSLPLAEPEILYDHQLSLSLSLSLSLALI